MNGKLLLVALVLGFIKPHGLAAALPAKNHKALSTRKNTFHGRLGIFDGKSTTIAKHKYLVSIVVNSNFYCAGVILSESLVLTNGDCAYELAANEMTIVAGSSDGTTGTSYSVKKIHIHPKFKTASGSYDYALLKIKGNFTFGEDVGMATLPSADPASGAALVVAGWGETSALGVESDGALLQGTMKYMTADDCETYYADYSDVTFDASMSCAYNKGKTTMCAWDFGNPFTQGDVVYGLFAAAGASGSFCDKTAIPVIISNIYTVLDWINKF